MIYILKRKKPAGWDELENIVVRASSSQEARSIAADNSCDEGRTPWLDPKLTSCRQVKQDGKSQVILVDVFNA